jgi:hypothetical protein
MAKASNIYGKLAQARSDFHKLELKKTGYNKFAGYPYFELGDFLIPAMECLMNNGLVTLPPVFTKKRAILTLKEIDGDGEIKLESPMIEAEYIQTATANDGTEKVLKMVAGANLKGCHPIQNLGAVETYQRRYLWVSLMEIVEHDALDATTGADDKKPAAKTAKKKATKKTASKKAAPKAKVTPIKGKDKAKPVEQKEVEDDFYLEDEEAAEEFAQFMIKTATEMHSGSKDALIEFWRINLNASNYLKDHFPDQYQVLLDAFGELKSNLIEGEENE